MTEATRPHRCDSCGNTSHLLPQVHRLGSTELFCPACTARTALHEAAEAQPCALLWPIVVDWAQHWERSGLNARAVESILDAVGTYWHPAGAFARPDGTRSAARAALAGEEL